jgi:hypothetical protein
MVNIDDLYNKIMVAVSKEVRRILDETLTTYPYNKVTNYILKLQKELNIIISQYIDERPTNPGFIPKEYLNDEGYDDKKIIVRLLTNDNISDNKELCEKLQNGLQVLGYKFSNFYIDKDSNIEYMSFIPNKQNSLNLNSLVFNITHHLYHICPHYVTEKIKENGFVPKSKNSIFKYDSKIHFCFLSTPYFELQELKRELDENNKSNGNDHQYDLITIRIPKDLKLYKDLDYQYGLYTIDNIGPEHIESIKNIDSISFDDYMLQKTGIVI